MRLEIRLAERAESRLEFGVPRTLDTALSFDLFTLGWRKVLYGLKGRRNY